jgi:hypothetical protein
MNEKKIIFFNNDSKKENKKIVIFGAGIVAKKCIENLNKSKILFIVDNNKKLWGSSFEGINIYDPNKLRKIDKKNILVVITTTSFVDVMRQLEKINYKLQRSVSYYLKDRIHIEVLQNLKKKILISSGLPPINKKNSGGGLYEIDLKGISWNIKKVYSGTVHGVIKFKDGYAISDSVNGIILLDKNYKILKKGTYPNNTRAHGIAFDNKRKLFYIVCSNTDQVKVFDLKLELKKSILISKKYKKFKSPQHHINDICIKDGYLYVSMFSLSGNHKRNIYDGGVCKISPKNSKIVKKIYGDLLMPHSIKYINKSFMILDSLRGNFVIGEKKVASFPGFSRGLSFDGKYFFIGQSRNRNFSMINNSKDNISIDNSILIYDYKNKSSRSLYLPNTISEIHEVLVL